MDPRFFADQIWQNYRALVRDGGLAPDAQYLNYDADTGQHNAQTAQGATPIDRLITNAGLATGQPIALENGIADSPPRTRPAATRRPVLAQDEEFLYAALVLRQAGQFIEIIPGAQLYVLRNGFPPLPIPNALLLQDRPIPSRGALRIPHAWICWDELGFLRLDVLFAEPLSALGRWFSRHFLIVGNQITRVDRSLTWRGVAAENRVVPNSELSFFAYELDDRTYLDTGQRRPGRDTRHITINRQTNRLFTPNNPIGGIAPVTELQEFILEIPFTPEAIAQKLADGGVSQDLIQAFYVETATSDSTNIFAPPGSSWVNLMGFSEGTGNEIKFELTDIVWGRKVRSIPFTPPPVDIAAIESVAAISGDPLHSSLTGAPLTYRLLCTSTILL